MLTLCKNSEVCTHLSLIWKLCCQWAKIFTTIRYIKSNWYALEWHSTKIFQFHLMKNTISACMGRTQYSNDRKTEILWHFSKVNEKYWSKMEKVNSINNNHHDVSEWLMKQRRNYRVICKSTTCLVDNGKSFWETCYLQKWWS